MDEDAVRALIAEHFGREPGCASDGARFTEDLGADSLDIVELTMLLENDLGVAIGEEEGARCTCVGDALQLLREKMGSDRGEAATRAAAGQR